MILVLTNSVDATADYLISRFVEADVPYIRLDSDKAAQSCTVRSNIEETLLSIDSSVFCPADIESIWYRRPKPIQIREAGSRERALHVEGEWSEAIEGFLAQIPKKNWINHPADCALASHKIEQLARASNFGLRVPDTLVTQSIEDLTEFYRRHNRRVICKPMSSGLIEESD